MFGAIGSGDRAAINFIAPRLPSLSAMTREQLDEGAIAARFNDRINLIGFPGVFSLSSSEEIDLPSARRSCPQTPASAKEYQLCDVTEIKPDSAPIRTAILADFMPYDIGLVCEAPPLHYLEALEDQSIGNPKIDVRLFGSYIQDG